MQSTILNQLKRHYEQVGRLFDELGRYDETILNRPPVPGSWSAIQTLHHLILSEEGSYAYVRKKLGFQTEGYEKAGLRTRWRAFLLWLFLNTPLKFKAPAHVVPEDLPEQSSLAATRARWDAVQKNWFDFFQTLPAGLADKAVYRHPRAGRMSWSGMVGFFRQHRTRHEKQIRRALK